MSHARYEIDRVAKVNNSIRMDKRTARKTFAHYICNDGGVITRGYLGGALPLCRVAPARCAAPRRTAVARRAAARRRGGRFPPMPLPFVFSPPPSPPPSPPCSRSKKRRMCRLLSPSPELRQQVASASVSALTSSQATTRRTRHPPDSQAGHSRSLLQCPPPNPPEAKAGNYNTSVKKT